MAATAGASLGAVAIRFFGRFEQRMSRVSAITNATSLNFKRLSDEARKLGRSTQFSASQVAQAQSEFAVANFKTNQILKALEPTLKLAVAGELGIAEAADIAIRVLGGMGQTADDLEGSLEILARGFTTSSTNIRELGQAFKFVAPLASASGQSLIQITAILQAFAKASVRGTMAGTQLRNVLLRFAIQPGRVREQFDRLKISVDDSLGNFRPLADVIDDLNEKFKTMTQRQKISTIGQIAGLRAVAGFTQLIKIGGAEIRKLEAALEATGSVLDRISFVQMNTLQGSLKRLISAFEGFGIAIGGILNNFVRPLIEGTARALNQVEGFIERNSTLMVFMIRLTAGWVKELADALFVTKALTVSLDALGLSGPTALSRLHSGIVLLETGIQRVLLAINIVELAFKGLFLDIGLELKFFALTVVPTMFISAGIFIVNLIKALVTAVVQGLRQFAESFKKIFQVVLALAKGFAKSLGDIFILGITGSGFAAINSAMDRQAADFLREMARLKDDFIKTQEDIQAKLVEAFTVGLLKHSIDIPDRATTALQNQIKNDLGALILAFNRELEKTRVQLSIFDPEFDLPRFANSIADATEEGMKAGIDRVSFDPRAAPLAERGTLEAFRAERGIRTNRVEANTRITAEENLKQTELLLRLEDALTAAEETIEIL